MDPLSRGNFTRLAQPNFKSSTNSGLSNSLCIYSTTISMDAIDKIPKPVLAGFAALGALFVSNKVLSYVRLLLSLFVLSGKNVCALST